MKRIVYIFIFLFSTSLVTFGQITVQARIDSSKILIGEQTKIHFEVTQDKKTKVQFPILSDSIIKGVDIVSVLKPDTTQLPNGKIKIKSDVVITSFDSASYYIPSLKFVAGKDTFDSNPLSLKVYTLPVDTTKQAIYDIKPIYNAKINWQEVFTIVLIILLVLGVLAVIFFYIKKRFFTKKDLEGESTIPSLPPHELALKELDRIKNEKLWQQGRIKEYYTDISTVLRQYIEHRYQVAALEMTSEDILDSMKLMEVTDKAVQNGLKQILHLSDLVKFAKWTPSLQEHDLTLNNAYLFVSETKQIIIEEKIEEPVELDKMSE